MALIAVAVVLTVAAGAWLLGTESALHWLLARAESATQGALRVQEAHGSLWNGVHAAQLRYTDAGFVLSADDVELRLRLPALVRKTVDIDRLIVEKLAIKTRGGEGTAPLPSSLELPFGVEIRMARVAQLRWQAGERVLPEAALTLQLGSDGRHHRLSHFNLQSANGKLKGGGRLDGRRPFPIEGTFVASDLPGGITGAKFGLSGELEKLRLSAETDEPWLAGSAHLDLTPFGAVSWRGARVELDRFQWAGMAGMPPVRLRGRGELHLGSADHYEGEFELENEDTGSLPERVPLSRVSARVQGGGGVWQFDDLNGALPSGENVGGAAQWNPAGIALNISTTGLDLQSLHRDFARTRLAGGLKAELGSEGQNVDVRLADGKFHFEVRARRDARAWIVEKGKVRAGRGELVFEGRVENAPARDFQAQGRLRDFDPSAFGRFPAARINSDLSASGVLAGDWRAEVQMQVRDSVFRGQPLKGTARAVLEAGRITRTGADLALGNGRLTAQGALGKPGDRLDLGFDLPRLDAVLDGWRGQAKGNLQLEGALMRPGVKFDLQGSQLAASNGLKAAKIDAKGAVSSSADAPLSFALQSRGVHFGENVSLEDLAVNARGSRRAHRVDVEARGRDWNAQAGMNAGLAENWQWSGVLAKLAATPETLLRLEAPVRFSVSPSLINLGSFVAYAQGARVQSDGFLLSEAQLKTSGRVSGLPLAPILKHHGWTLLRTDLRVAGEWNVDRAEKLNGMVRLWRESGEIGLAGDLPQQLRLGEARVELSARDNGLDMQARLATDSLGAFQARVRTTAALQTGGWTLPRTAPLALEIAGDRLSLAWLGQVIHPQLASAGELTLRVRGEGTLAQPRLQGSLEGRGLGVSVPRHGLLLKDGVLRASLSGELLRLEELRLHGEEGVLRAHGEAMLSEMAPSLRLMFDAEHLSLLQRQDWALNLDTQGVLETGRGGTRLTGALKINRGLLGELDDAAPTLSEDVRILGEERVTAPEAPPPQLQVDVTVDLGDHLRVRTRPVRTGVVGRLPMTNTGVDVRLAGGLRIRGDGTEPPRAEGKVRMVDGQYMAFGQRLNIRRGEILFAGPLLDPALDIVALRDDPEVVVGVQVAGTASAPRVSLFSQPDVSDTEKLTWLLFGRGAQPLDHSVTGLGTASAGVSSFGFQLSKRLYLAYEQGVAGTGSMMRLYSQLTRRLSAQWRSGTENSVRLFYTFLVK